MLSTEKAVEDRLCCLRLKIERGVVRKRVVSVPRSVEIKPLFSDLDGGEWILVRGGCLLTSGRSSVEESWLMSSVLVREASVDLQTLIKRRRDWLMSSEEKEGGSDLEASRRRRDWLTSSLYVREASVDLETLRRRRR